jgi:hypothetical protein
MIGIYNETLTNWVAKEYNEKILNFSKAKEYNRNGKQVRGMVSIGTYSSNFTDVAPIISKLEHLTNMTEVGLVSNITTSVMFNRKDYSPFIINKDISPKDILLISLDLKAKKIVEISSENVFLLEGFLMGGELSIIATLNNKQSTLNVKLLDSDRDKVVTYTFSVDPEKNKFYVDLDEMKADCKPEDIQFKLKRFRPAKPTYAIITHTKDTQKLKSIVDPEKHYIVEITKQNIDSVIEKLAGEEKYKAVTLFLNTDEVTDTTRRMYGSIITKLQEQFRIYYEMLNTNKIIKAKY